MTPDDLDRLALHLCLLLLGVIALYGLVRLVRREWRYYKGHRSMARYK